VAARLSLAGIAECRVVWCDVLQCVAVRCSALIKKKTSSSTSVAGRCCSVLWCITVLCSVVRCVAVCCGALQCVAVR